MTDITSLDWAYLAGIVDGEGTIGAYTATFQPRIVVAMSTEQPVLWIYETFGGKYKAARKAQRRDGLCDVRYTWGVYSREWVAPMLEGLLPFLKLKQTKAEEVLGHIYRHSSFQLKG